MFEKREFINENTPRFRETCVFSSYSTNESVENLSTVVLKRPFEIHKGSLLPDRLIEERSTFTLGAEEAIQSNNF